jgi:hypothetical protein
MGLPLTHEEVDNEMREAVEEGKFLEINQEETLEQQVLVEVVSKKPDEKGKKQAYNRMMARRLRLRDNPSINKTCGVCLTRVPLYKIQNGRVDVCDDCN